MSLPALEEEAEPGYQSRVASSSDIAYQLNMPNYVNGTCVQSMHTQWGFLKTCKPSLFQLFLFVISIYFSPLALLDLELETNDFC